MHVYTDGLRALLALVLRLLVGVGVTRGFWGMYTVLGRGGARLNPVRFLHDLGASSSPFPRRSLIIARKRLDTLTLYYINILFWTDI